MSLTPDQVARKLWAATWGSQNRAPVDADKAYWTTDFWNALDAHGDSMNPPHPDYAYDRAIGWQSTGADVPPYGPYAQPPTQLQPVPPYPGDVEANTGTSEPLVPASLLGDVLQKLAEISAVVNLNLLATQGIVTKQDEQAARIEAIRAEVIAAAKTLAPQVGLLGRFFGR